MPPIPAPGGGGAIKLLGTKYTVRQGLQMEVDAHVVPTAAAVGAVFGTAVRSMQKVALNVMQLRMVIRCVALAHLRFGTKHMTYPQCTADGAAGRKWCRLLDDAVARALCRKAGMPAHAAASVAAMFAADADADGATVQRGATGRTVRPCRHVGGDHTGAGGVPHDGNPRPHWEDVPGAHRHVDWSGVRSARGVAGGG